MAQWDTGRWDDGVTFWDRIVYSISRFFSRKSSDTAAAYAARNHSGSTAFARNADDGTAVYATRTSNDAGAFARAVADQPTSYPRKT